MGNFKKKSSAGTKPISSAFECFSGVVGGVEEIAVVSMLCVVDFDVAEDCPNGDNNAISNKRHLTSISSSWRLYSIVVERVSFVLVLPHEGRFGFQVYRWPQHRLLLQPLLSSICQQYRLFDLAILVQLFAYFSLWWFNGICFFTGLCIYFSDWIFLMLSIINESYGGTTTICLFFHSGISFCGVRIGILPFV